MKHRFITLTVSLFILLTSASQVAQSQRDFPSTSPIANGQKLPVQIHAISDEETDSITFSEFPIDTSISNQYSSRGIIFGGDSPFISPDGSNPTSPVLSGTPRFRGDIEGTFVDPSDGVTPVVVESFTLDAGYFDELASTRIEWFDLNGRKLGQRTNTSYGIETFKIEGGDIARWRISIIKTEPAGYAIDNVSFEPVQASVLFREKSGDEKDGTWGYVIDQIPGFDHTALSVENLVYESHPGYAPGTYYSKDGLETASIVADNGVQAQHTKETFRHDAQSPGAENSPVIGFEEIPIDIGLAKSMRDHINAQTGATFQFIDYDSLETTLSPSAQKGGGGTFTCVGLIEWAAEQAGHKNGQGFIRNSFESIPIVDFPLLSPQLLNWSMKGSTTWDDINQWYQGIFDPVDFMITDPFGRKLGYTESLGERNEIPNAFYSGNGNVEQFLIPNPIAGTYQVEFIGLGAQVYGAMASSQHTDGINTDLAPGENLTTTFYVEVQPGVPGDVNSDGCINESDVEELSGRLNTFPDSLADPADIDGNGIIENIDLDLLHGLIMTNLPCADAPAPPDLIVQEIIATTTGIQVVVKNQGAGPVSPEHDFWVDVYINPASPPTKVNETWKFLGDWGLVWGVVAPAVPLPPGGTVTLSINDSYFWPTHSNFPATLPPGTAVYAQVDSANTTTTYGGVLENHEATGGVYNNIFGPVYSVDVSANKLHLPIITRDGLPSAAGVRQVQVEPEPSVNPLPSRP